MELRHRVGVYTRQSVVISSQVIQSINILQYGTRELESYLQEQAERNPLIEVARGTSRQGAAALVDATGKGAITAAPPGWRSGGGSGAARTQARDTGPEHYVAAPVSLCERLMHQAAQTFRDATDVLIARELIESIDSDGYLRADLGRTAQRLGVAPGRLDAVLTRVQAFEPAGVGARDLAECLALQLREKDRLDPAMQRLLENLPLLASSSFKALSRVCGVNFDDIAQMVQEIRQLDPRPGRRYDASPTPPALPDVFVVATGPGCYRVELNTDLLPRVLVDRQYHARITAKPLGQKDKQFVTDCLRNARWLARNLDRRAQTVLKVAAEIVARQSDFLEKGVDHLRPLNLKDVAAAVGVHESTICRATANKFMMTDRGMVEFKYFFKNAISATEGEADHSSETVRHRIGALIGAETAETILSDEQIVQELRKDGIEIARRTVAKYRDMMRIPSSLQRRRRMQIRTLA